MRLGLIARSDRSGLANQTHEFYRHMQPERVLVIDVGHLQNDSTHCNKQTDLSKYANPMVFKGWQPDRGTLKQFLCGLDVVFSAECLYSPELPALAHRFGVKTVNQCNPEFLNVREIPDLWAPPTGWMWDSIPEPKTLLPVPIATDRFTPVLQRNGEVRRFLHIVGRPAHADRNGTEDLLASLRFVESNVSVVVKCQHPGHVEGLLGNYHIPSNVTLTVESGDVQDYWRLYDGFDCLILPRRFGGLCLPCQEALGAGLPVIMPNISPNEWLPSEWLIPASKRGSFVAKQRIDFVETSPQVLARKIDQFAQDAEFFKTAQKQARELADSLSWTALKPRYEEVLGNV